MKIKWFKLMFIILFAGLIKSQFLNADSSFVSGTKLSLPFCQAKMAFTEEKYNFGFAGFSDNICKVFPFTIMCGNLSAGGALSKMNSPLLSFGTSAFSTGISDANCVTASLPGTSSFSKPVSTFFQVGYKNKKSPFNCKVSLFYSPEENISVFSEYSNCSFFGKKLVLSNSITAGIFPYEEFSSSSWILDSQYYSEGNHFCSFFQFSVKFLNCISVFSTGLYESPFGDFNKIFRLDFKLPVNHFVFFCSGVYNPDFLIITSSDKKIDDCFQIKTGLQYKSIIPAKKQLFMKTAFNLSLDADTSGTEHPFRINSGIQILSSLTSVSLSNSTKINMNTANQNAPAFNVESLSFQLKNNWYFKKLSAGLTATVGITPAEDFFSSTKKFSSRLNLNFSGNPKIIGYAGYSFTDRESVISSKKITTGITANAILKSFTCTLKFSADFTI